MTLLEEKKIFFLFLPGLLTEFSQGHCWWIPRRQHTRKTKRFCTCWFWRDHVKFAGVRCFRNFDPERLAWSLRVLFSRLWFRTYQSKFARVVLVTPIPNVSREVCTCRFRDFDPKRVTWSLLVLFSRLWSQTCHVKSARAVFSTSIPKVPRELCRSCFHGLIP